MDNKQYNALFLPTLDSSTEQQLYSRHRRLPDAFPCQQHQPYEGHAKPFVQMPSAQIEGIDRTFFSLAIRSKIYVSFFGRYSKGIRANLWDLSPFALTSIPFVVPPLSAQRSIVSYLDAKCSKIDKLIANITKEIECIREYKQRLISDVVTGQIKVC